MSTKMKLSYAKDEPKAPNVFPDFQWAGEHWSELNKKYGDVVVVVYEKQVIGVGKTEAEALADAEAKLPENSETITPIVKYIGSPYRIRRVNRKAAQG